MKVEQIMSKQIQRCQPDDHLEHAAQIMWHNDVGCLVVCEPENYNSIVGMITDRDITMCALFKGKALHELPVSDAMSGEVFFCHASDSLMQVEKIMRMSKIRRLPVFDQHESLVGLISLADLAQEAARERALVTKEITENEVTATYAAICHSPIRAMAA